ncbi:7-carboxy-7-deazaguanine synthase QueE [Campylobacter vulpis]|uniref:7-carboxy-7-deazaguanine synthase QueE n=1 Tax=Campylobacter vulpis TaxID=1655500 RepID=UPI001BCCAFE1|nr:7-carboxy-7-deazaguanine synthase QueE [Campylobacter vulpis]MBS4235366.1 7-carboxy-7-deazaguanine synthase QueE [Campylobacter vulpis]MBS4268713.1 7-carboxy-7-deazaguanine synthase QueE [Campylobacter vulpis]
MQVVESFLSIQGEGKFAGNLAVFVRFSGCNFNCVGFNVKKQKEGKELVGCDTLRAVFTKEYQNTYSKFNAKELFLRVLTLAKDFKPIVVITGGEPLIHHKKPEFLRFITLLLEANFEVHFETNASIKIDFKKYPLYKKCIFALGIKLSNSGVSKEKRLNYKALKAFKKKAKKSFYKFVLEEKFLNKAEEEIEEILSVVKNEVYCMPLGENETKLKKNALALVNFCLKNGYNYTDRMHIRLWGDKEGV